MTTIAGQAASAVRKTTLDNGLRVVTADMPHARSVSICVFVGVGSRYEPEGQAGISHMVEHLMFKGTARRPTPLLISGAVEGVGGMIDAGTEQELTVYWCKVARPYLDESLDLLLDMLRNSVFAPADIERERMVVIEEQNMVNDSPSHKVDALIDELLWPGHPLGRDIAGTRESVSQMSRQMIVDHVSRTYVPANVVVSVAGQVDHDPLVGQVDGLCDGWPSHPVPSWTPFHHDQPSPRLRLEYRKTEQAHLSIGLPGLSMTHPDRFALDLLSVALGEGTTSRLFLEVREKQGLAYDIHSGVSHFLDCGALFINAGVDPKRVHVAIETILDQASRLRDGLPDDEVERAKRFSTGSLMLRMEETRAVSSWLGSQELLLGRVLDVDDVVALVNRVTPDDLRRAAKELLMTEKLNMAVVGPHRGEQRFLRSLAL
jgi:predicted Zn-dependent peptidase